MLDNVRRFTTTSNGFLSSPSIRRGVATAATSNRNLNMQTLADVNIGGGGGGFSSSYSGTGKQTFVGMLDGFLPDNQRVRNHIFRDIYRHDPVAGAAVEIYATMPFSDFYLTGLKDRDAIDVYRKSVERMRLKIMLAPISRDYLIYGRFVGTTVFDKQSNMFSAIMPQNSNNISITEVPIYGMDPLIDLNISDQLKSLLKNKKDPRVANIIASLPDYIRDNLTQSNIPLSPANTLFIPRRTDTGDSIGTSYFERILPIHIMEKAMVRGSTDQAQRRQRAIMHITVSGDGDEYVPTIENLESIRNLFKQADEDPTGAIIVTHSGVQPNEVRDAASFFRADELFEYFNSTKYKALGISEAMITGEANFNSMDATLSLFIENLREYRAMMTRELFYEKIFPAIAVANGFYKEHYQVTGSDMMGHNGGPNIWGNSEDGYSAVCAGTNHGFNVNNVDVDTSELAMPTVSWQKHLRPEGDSAYLDALSAAEQHGVPIPLAMMSSAAGVDINAILNNLNQEVALRKRVQAYKDKIAEFTPDANGQDAGYNAQASLTALASETSNKPISMLSRDYPDYTLPHEKKKNGSFRPTSAKRRKQLYGQQMKVLEQVLKNNRKREIIEDKKNRKSK